VGRGGEGDDAPVAPNRSLHHVLGTRLALHERVGAPQVPHLHQPSKSTCTQASAAVVMVEVVVVGGRGVVNHSHPPQTPNLAHHRGWDVAPGGRWYELQVPHHRELEAVVVEVVDVVGAAVVQDYE